MGLTRENIDRLTAGMPILVHGESVGVPGVSVAIAFGETEQDCLRDLREAGVTTPLTDLSGGAQ